MTHTEVVLFKGMDTDAATNATPPHSSFVNESLGSRAASERKRRSTLLRLLRLSQELQMRDMGDLVAEALAAAGVRRGYFVPGGFMWLQDAIDRHPDLTLYLRRGMNRVPLSWRTPTLGSPVFRPW